MKKEKPIAPALEGEKKSEAKPKYDKPFRQPGGVYFHYGEVIGHKNVFVTKEYMDLLVNAFKLAELKQDIKNLAYVIMPNFFFWMFRLPEKMDNPADIYGEVKGQVATEVMKYLRKEIKEGAFDLLDIFKPNDRVGRSLPQKILWSFEEQAKAFENNKRYKIWTPKTRTCPIDNDEKLRAKLAQIKKAPVSDRWRLVESAEKYPYLYLSEEVATLGEAGVDLASFCPVIQVNESVEVKT